jgi:hypothetical protein
VNQLSGNTGINSVGQGTALNKDAAGSELKILITQALPVDTSVRQQVLDNLQTFLGTVPATDKVLVQTVTPTVTTGGSAPAFPLIISGSDRTTDGKQALVIDVSKLPKGTLNELPTAKAYGL